MLEDENARLKHELREAMAEITLLREENHGLKKRLKDAKLPFNGTAAEERTFVTNGSENPSVRCDNWYAARGLTAAAKMRSRRASSSCTTRTA